MSIQPAMSLPLSPYAVKSAEPLALLLIKPTCTYVTPPASARITGLVYPTAAFEPPTKTLSSMIAFVASRLPTFMT